MKRIFYIAAVALLCSSCFHVNKNYNGGIFIKGSGPIVSKTFDFKDFDTIDINGGADVTFTQAEDYNVTVRTQESVLDSLDYRMEGTKLILEVKDRKSIQADVFEISITAPELNKVTVSGASDLDIKGLRIDGDLEVQVNGAGDLDFDQIVCDNFSVQVNGAADAKLSSIDIRKLLKIEVNGAGDVDITGSAQDVTLEVNGAGDIDATGLKVAGEVKQHKAGIASIKL